MNAPLLLSALVPSRLRVGDAIAHRALTVFPILGADAPVEFISLERALPLGFALTEVPGGVVTALVAHNPTDHHVLLLDGQEVIGARQNRVFDGTFLVAWAESDGMGSGVRGRVFSADGTPAGAPFAVNDTIAGEQSAPAVAGAGERFLVAFQSGGSVRARAFSAAGDPSLNREQPPTLGDFPVAAAGARPSVGVIGTGTSQAWWVVWEGAGAGSTDIFGRRFPL